MRAKDRQARERVVATRIGKAIRAARDEKGLTLEQLGQLADIDVSQLSKVERGLGGTGLATYERLAHELGLTLGELLQRAGLNERRVQKAASRRGAGGLGHDPSITRPPPRG